MLNRERLANKNKIKRTIKILCTGAVAIFFNGTGFAADNPCGVSCTETLVNQSAVTLLNQANQYTNTQIDSRVYEKVVVFAENAVSIITGGGNQWAYGDGDTGTIGIPFPEDWELFAVSFQARSITASTDVTMVVRNNNGAGSNLYLFTFPLNNLGLNSYTEILTTPVPVPAGTTIGFLTSSVSAGTVTGARVAAWFRRHPD